MLLLPYLLIKMAEIWTIGVKHHAEQLDREKNSIFSLCHPVMAHFMSLVSWRFHSPNFRSYKINGKMKIIQISLCQPLKPSFGHPQFQSQPDPSVNKGGVAFLLKHVYFALPLQCRQHSRAINFFSSQNVFLIKAYNPCKVGEFYSINKKKSF
jgi:hypothetical protein